MKISLIHATRRPTRCVAMRELWLANTTDVEHIFGVDSDDQASLEVTAPFKRVVVAEPKGCFRAYNLAAKASTGTLIIPIEDDLWCQPGWDEQVRKAMDGHDTEIAVLSVNDGHNPIIEWAITRAFFDARGLYHDSYYGLFGDTELRQRIRADNILRIEAPDILFEHRQVDPAAQDPVYLAKQGRFHDDDVTANARARAGYPD